MKYSANAAGMYERHLMRKDANPLFHVPVIEYGPEEYLAARKNDSEEQARFHADMREIIQQAIELKPNEQSEVILELRGRLDQLYARCSGFGGGCGEHKENIRKLIDLVMKAVWHASADDPVARQELEQEELARQQHFVLLEYPLVSDLLRPDTPVSREELLPSLLCSDKDELEAVLWLFEPQQLEELTAEAEKLLHSLREQGFELSEAWERLSLMQEHLEE